MSAVAKKNHPNRGARPCQTPNVDQVRRAQARAGLTNAQCADLVCVAQRTWENWVLDPSSSEHRPMPAGAWKLFRYEIGLLDPPKPKKS